MININQCKNKKYLHITTRTYIIVSISKGKKMLNKIYKVNNIIIHKLEFLFLFVILIVLIFIPVNSCDKDDPPFPCEQPYLYTVPGIYQTDVEVTNSPIPELIPNGTYWVRVEIFDCYFTGDCSGIYRKYDRWSVDDAGAPPNTWYAIGVSGCSMILTTNIPVLSESEYPQLTSDGKGAVVFFTDSCDELPYGGYGVLWDILHVSKVKDISSKYEREFLYFEFIGSPPPHFFFQVQKSRTLKLG